VTIQVADSSEKTASKRFSFIVVEDGKLAIMTETLPDAQVGQFYTARVRGCGGTKPYAWTTENLPNWLTLDSSSGILSGTPSEPAIHDLMVRLRDNEDATDSKLLRLSIYPHDGLLIETGILPAAIYEQDYTAQLEALGGIAPYFFALRRGISLPSGLALSGTGVLSGRPNQKGVYDFAVDAMDGNSLQGSAIYTVVVVGEDAMNPGGNEFTVKEYENGKQIRLSFYLPKDFNEASILSIEALTSPDVYIVRSDSVVTKATNGVYRAELTLYAAEQVLNGGMSWETLMNTLSFEGFVVLFPNASGEAIRFEKALPVREMKKEDEAADGNDGGGGGCNALGFGLSVFLPLALWLWSGKKTV
jgi:hypothetical protein